jgi:hypothetical protein
MAYVSVEQRTRPAPVVLRPEALDPLHVLVVIAVLLAQASAAPWSSNSLVSTTSPMASRSR